jgi:hypothetical protein
MLAIIRKVVWFAVLALAAFIAYAVYEEAFNRSRRCLIRRRLRRLKEQSSLDPAGIAEEPLPSYRYQPLQGPASKQIRLLDLLPDATIQLRTVSLAGPDVPEYEALSYCWGDPNELYAIRCNDAGDEDQKEEYVWVPRGIIYALARLTSKDRVRVLWIDAVCINQADLSEKSWQVAMMTDIYKNASRVVVYLGYSDRRESRLGEYIPRLLHAKERVDAAICSGITWEAINSNRDLRRSLELPPSREIHRMQWAMQDLLQNPWFQRVWIIQEIALARDAVVISGEWELPWKSLLDAYKWMDENKLEGIMWCEDQFNDGHRLSRFEKSKANAMREDIRSLLLYHRGTLASNPRDHVFAFVGLAEDGNQFSVDYSLSPSEILKDTARHILVAQNKLGFLCSAGLSQRTDPRLPTWVPDWRTTVPWAPLFHIYPRSVTQFRATCSDTDLYLEGFQVGTVHARHICPWTSTRT